MRVILAFLVGIAVTVGGAYIHDASLPEASKQRLVNWDTTLDLARWSMARAREEFDKLTSK